MDTNDGAELAVVDSFYRAFEDRYRGSRELIKSRLAKYMPFVQPLATLYPGEKTFDLGCGRGEWLELMVETGFTALGADLDAEMLEACRERNLPVLQADAIAHLATLESDSHALISAFHVVEHVSFDQLRSLVSEALRVLKPGGLLILETPNPENIAVATSNFYLDPSHQKPIPPLLLSFVVEHAGFDRVKVVRLQEAPELNDAAVPVGFLDVLRGASPDYAIVAQKDANSSQGAFDDAFAAEYGLTIDVLVHRYEARIASSISQLDARLGQTQERLRSSEEILHITQERLRSSEEILHITQERLFSVDGKLHTADERLYSVERKLHTAEERLYSVEGKLRSTEGRLHIEEHQRQQVEERLEHAETQMHGAEHRARHAEEVAHQANAQLQLVHVQLDAVYRSMSWRVTAPMRWVSLALRGKQAVTVKQALKPVLGKAGLYVSKRPWLRWPVFAVLNRMPRVKARLTHVVTASTAGLAVDLNTLPNHVERLSEHANRIHASLTAEFDKSQREKR
ncbi:methyltransferase domain-containing protein [Paraburkholderia sp. CNPSo 3274]|uniref:methyltransferase domain-containing protein n=1 Tax=Paraburkholderia sp. CNPSo 3274 TaxID=2940932 RepID=UPI0020B77392|nr:methyltransferase domain-containing protein [Paraburkholderia sp. CNPSo 3274]MCP3709234.1 methyltransferase domain-containing protein [Paraburkholderia sp. CNPSo 3274]